MKGLTVEEVIEYQRTHPRKNKCTANGEILNINI